MQLENGDKIFSVDYRVLDNGSIKHFLTYAPSRKYAENKVREMEEPHRINIVKICQVQHGPEFDEAFSLALEQFQANNTPIVNDSLSNELL